MNTHETSARKCHVCGTALPEEPSYEAARPSEPGVPAMSFQFFDCSNPDCGRTTRVARVEGVPHEDVAVLPNTRDEAAWETLPVSGATSQQNALRIMDTVEKQASMLMRAQVRPTVVNVRESVYAVLMEALSNGGDISYEGDIIAPYAIKTIHVRGLGALPVRIRPDGEVTTPTGVDVEGTRIGESTDRLN